MCMRECAMLLLPSEKENARNATHKNRMKNALDFSQTKCTLRHTSMLHEALLGKHKPTLYK